MVIKCTFTSVTQNEVHEGCVHRRTCCIFLEIWRSGDPLSQREFRFNTNIGILILCPGGTLQQLWSPTICSLVPLKGTASECTGPCFLIPLLEIWGNEWSDSLKHETISFVEYGDLNFIVIVMKNIGLISQPFCWRRNTFSQGSSAKPFSLWQSFVWHSKSKIVVLCLIWISTRWLPSMLSEEMAFLQSRSEWIGWCYVLDPLELVSTVALCIITHLQLLVGRWPHRPCPFWIRLSDAHCPSNNSKPGTSAVGSMTRRWLPHLDAFLLDNGSPSSADVESSFPEWSAHF